MTSPSNLEAAAGNPLLAAAVDDAGRGWPVFPCRPRTKTPATAHGLKDATLDVGLIEAWWTRWPDANVAIATGQPSGLVVVDVESKASAPGTACDRFGMPPSATVETPSGGLHVYFEHDFAHGDVRNSAGRVAPGIDVRGSGGYVVAPPSRLGGAQAYAAA
jgi:hypothetical protein